MVIRETIAMSAHNVEKIELISTFLSNGNSRRIRITNDLGCFELTVFGNTEAFDGLPKSDDFIATGSGGEL